MVPLFSVFVFLAILVGWRLRDHHLLSPRHGLGLELGVLGTILMILLFIYPLRKRMPSLHFLGGIPRCFQIHMILGILGPLCILFHANFHLGSFNSNVALMSMLIVSGSGVVGRLIYVKIHEGLYGKRLNLENLKNQWALNKQLIGEFWGDGANSLFQFADQVLTPPRSFIQSFVRIFTLGWKVRLFFLTVKRSLPNRSDQFKIRHFLKQTLQVAEFSFFERLFSLWHVLHIPLVYVLVATVVIHITLENFYF